MTSNDSFTSKYFSLEQLSEGVYAAIQDIQSEAGWAGCNAGIIDLGDRTLVFDAFESPEAAADLREAAETLTAKPVHAVINSHYHNDHIWGNQVFAAQADIISTMKTREMIAAEGPEEIRAYREQVPKQLEAMETQWKEETDEANIAQLKICINYYRAIAEALPLVQLRLPNVTFSGSMTFVGSRRSARLLAFEGGHCASDAILHLPAEGIIFMADLLFVDCHPYLPEADPDKIKHNLAEIKKLGAKTFVPGHGPLGQSHHLDWMEDYVDTLNTLVAGAISQGAAKEEVEKITIPGQYRQLVMPSFFAVNLKYLYQKQIAG